MCVRFCLLISWIFNYLDQCSTCRISMHASSSSSLCYYYFFSFFFLVSVFILHCWVLFSHIFNASNSNEQLMQYQSLVYSNASNSNEQHDMEINSACVAAEEDVAKNSKDLFEQFDAS